MEDQLSRGGLLFYKCDEGDDDDDDDDYDKMRPAEKRLWVNMLENIDIDD